MKSPKPKTILTVLDCIDWAGHIEISESDKRWLANEIASALNEDEMLCGVCNELKPVVVQTPIGTICEDCIDEAAGEAEQIRDEMEDDND